ncbi:MAG: di-heme oxidoredictase family protein [Pseudomonadota bacterium]
MRTATALLTICLAGPVHAVDWGLTDVHLDVIPRTQAERDRIAGAVALPRDFSKPNRFEELSAGGATVPIHRDDPFAQPAGTVTFEKELDFRVGEAMFQKIWVSAPSSTLGSDGLGPLFNARACSACHILSGRGHPPEDNDDTTMSMLMRVSVPREAGISSAMAAEIEGYLTDLPHPTYGNQIQDLSVAGHRGEARMLIDYEDIVVEMSEGQSVTLQKPLYSLGNLAYGPTSEDIRMSPRVAPQMIGLGLLEAIPVEDILALADPADVDGDGISGKPQIVWSTEFEQPMLGRFGLKAGMPTLRQQNADAFTGDIGISTPLTPRPYGDCTEAQSACRAAHHGDGDVRVHEVDDVGLDIVTYYSANLGVPIRRNHDDPQVLRGKEVFYTTGCVACHQPAFVTHRLEDDPERSFQLIWPYTDMLLHDMGPLLADNRPEGRANGREWRTPPLWGIGLTERVSGHTRFLHDGRARSLLEAVLWHGGEAQAQQEAVRDMSAADRDALISFLESL